MTDVDRWLVRTRPVAWPRLRLVCFPYAGGSASLFRTWPAALPADVEVVAVQPPGRENRIDEPLLTEMSDMVAAVATAVEDLLDVPYAMFGHSLGAIVGFELARFLRRAGRPSPAHLFVAARPAPQIGLRDRGLHRLPDREFLAKVRELNGTDEELFRHPDLLELLTPMLRADFAVSDSHRHRPEPPLSCPVTAYFGGSDLGSGSAQMAGWGQHTTAAFALRRMPGDHFFIHSYRDQLLADLRRQVGPHRRDRAHVASHHHD
jgi:medium-chain acyl-[acyl-carrier-protein] hydrolase